MAHHVIEAKGLRCPQPVLKLTAFVPKVAAGDVVEIHGDCSTFEDDVRKWCARMKKTVLSVRPDGDAKIIQVQF